MKTFPNLNDPEIIERLQAGQVGVLPSDSVYGLMCVASNPKAVKRLYELKQRDGKPGTLIGASVNQFAELGLDVHQLALAEQYWPGPVSVIVRCSTKLSYLHLGRQSLAVRIPNFADLLAILQTTGVLQTSSANLTGQPVATTIDEAKDYFRDEVDFYVDGGNLANRQASTIISLINNKVEVVRQGSVQVVANQ